MNNKVRASSMIRRPKITNYTQICIYIYTYIYCIMCIQYEDKNFRSKACGGQYPYVHIYVHVWSSLVCVHVWWTLYICAYIVVTVHTRMTLCICACIFVTIQTTISDSHCRYTHTHTHIYRDLHAQKCIFAHGGWMHINIQYIYIYIYTYIYI